MNSRVPNWIAVKSQALNSFGIAAFILGLTLTSFSAAQNSSSILAWAPKPAELSPWQYPNKPHWKLIDLLSENSPDTSWAVTVVEDKDFRAQYILMAAGEKTPLQFYADHRALWVVQEGQIRFSIEGQEPFIATKGFLVQVPYRVPFSLETVGDAPSLRFEVTSADAKPLFLASEMAPDVQGLEYVPVRVSGQGRYDDQNRPYLDFWKTIVDDGQRAGSFMSDDRHFANLIRGRGAPPPAASNTGHFHLGYGEFWLVMEGQIDVLIEGLPLISAQQGDVVYAPAGRYHRASWGGDGMATRLAINPFPHGLHNYPAPH